MAIPDPLDEIPEFSSTRSIKIAPNMTVPITDRLLAIIDSAAYQRLRKIRQLSLSDRVFPSATHTRFSHGLGVYKNVLDYLRHLNGNAAFRERFQARDYLAIMLAGLLHDLGHYPLSHQLDHIPPFPKHEALTIALIQGEMTIGGENLATIIRAQFGLDPTEITCFFGPESALPAHKALLKQIIDSPVDADKCDYLPRDSYFCGVDYAQGFDRERFITYLAPSRFGKTLCIQEKGLLSAERFQLARYWMYRSVYWGHTVRALITMLSKACEYLQDKDQLPDWPSPLLDFNDHNFLEWLHGRVAAPGKELIEMVHHRREPYKRVYTLHFHHDPETYEKLQNPQPRERITAWFAHWAAGQGFSFEPHHLIWDVPPIYKTDTWESFPIQLNDGEEVPIARESPIIDALSKAFLHGVRKIRLFCHPRLADRIRDRQGKIPALADLI